MVEVFAATRMFFFASGKLDISELSFAMYTVE